MDATKTIRTNRQSAEAKKPHAFHVVNDCTGLPIAGPFATWGRASEAWAAQSRSDREATHVEAADAASNRAAMLECLGFIEARRRDVETR